MSHLTLSQRYEIKALHVAQKSATFIAHYLNIHRSTVYRELERNSAGKRYEAAEADRRAATRCRWRSRPRKRSAAMEQQIVQYLRDGLSPEQIAGRCRLEGIYMISATSIYKYIYDDRKKGGELYKYLPRQHPKQRKRVKQNTDNEAITDKINISQRPEIVAQRSRIGDVEGDTIIGKQHKQAIVTLVERKTGFLLMKKVETKKAEIVRNAIVDLIKNNTINMPILTITFDNGTEFAQHKQMSEDLNAAIYFANPYHSWERGTNENTNGLVRRFFPKGTDFDTISEEQISEAQQKINNRPRKRLGFLSPIEAINLHQSQLNNVAFTT